MRHPIGLLSLPFSLLIVLFASSSISRAHHDDEMSISHANIFADLWPHNLPPHVKYWPEDPPYRRRDLEAVQALYDSGISPIAVRKMGVDESEKFWPHYWGFDETPLSSLDRTCEGAAHRDSIRAGYEKEGSHVFPNSSETLNIRPAFALHAEIDEAQRNSLIKRRGAADALAVLKRGFQCPSGTTNCSGIGYTNSCCATGESCVVITDTGLGPVGCCPSGSNCGGTITTCSADSTACPDSLGGGCCIPGYTCSGVGCVRDVVVTVTSTQVVTASSSTHTVLVTTTLTSSQTPTTTTDTSLQTTLACATNYHACPVNMGGGCCPTDRICTTGMVCPLSPGAASSTMATSQTASETTATSTATASAPARPTSIIDSITTTTSSPVITSGICPTGFYACSAYYAGGCCRTGRDCATTDCPTTASTTLISNVETIVVPLTGVATTTASGSCASGWSTCAMSLGGNCCPTGFACGTESCSSIGATSTLLSSKEDAAASGCVGRRKMAAGSCVAIAVLSGAVAALLL